MPEDHISSNRIPKFFIWVLFCFFFSGMAGLIYQVLWLRMIDKVIGSAPFAVATVLSVFMGGLALGSWLAGKYIDRIGSRRNLLSLYGKLEIAIGIYGLLLPFLIHGGKPLYVLVYDSLFLHFWTYRFFTFFGCSLLLIIPTTLMGATLPILCRFCIEDLGHIGRRTGRLYGINTIGAAVGAILCGFVLIAAFGVWGTLGTAIGINFLVGILCIALARKSRPLVSVPDAPVVGGKAKPGPSGYGDATRFDDRGIITLSLFIFAVSGFCAMAYEVFWTRLLGLIIGPTTYSFSLVVSTFIIGLALGNILFGWLADRVKGTFGLLIVTQACAAFLALLVSQFLGDSQFFFSKLIYTFQGSFGGKVLVQSLVLFFILVGPTIFLGATFPLVNRIYARSLPNIGRSIGTAYATNTIGAILGSFVAGFIFIPLLGKENGLRITAGLQISLSLFAMAYMAIREEKKTRPVATGLVTLFLGLLFISNFPSWNHNTLSRGWYYRFDALKQYFGTTSWTESILEGTSRVASHVKDTDVVFYGEGIGGFTTVEKLVNPTGTENYYLLNSGKTDATSHSDRLTQALSAHVPLLFHPNPRKVMVLGLASGMTAGEALLYPVEQLDVLEINEQVIKAAELFAPYNNNCLANPKTRMIIQDGRNHLELTRESYDVIISEPSNPWMAGLANLFTRDYFETVRKRLTKNGIFIQWTNAYDMDWDAFSMIGRTFAQVFPNGMLVKTIGESDFLLVGFEGEKNLDLEIAQKNLAYAMKSQNVTIRDPKIIFNLIVTEDLKELFGSGPVHTDIWPHLEFAAPKNIGRSTRTIRDHIRNYSRLSRRTENILELNNNIDTSLDYLELMTAGSSPPFSKIDLEKTTPAQLGRYQNILRSYCSDEYVTNYDILSNSADQRECAGLQIARIREHLSADPDDSKAYFRLAMGLGFTGNAEGKIDALRKAIFLKPTFYEAYIQLGETLSAISRFDEAVSTLSEASRINPDAAETYNTLGNVYADQGKADEAIFNFTRAFKIDPEFARAYNNIGSVYGNIGDTDEAIYYFSKAIDIDPDYADAHNNLGRVFGNQGRLEDALSHFLEAVRILPGNADFHNDAGMILGQQGKMDASIEQFSEALRLNPDLDAAHYNLGLALLKTGRLEEATEYLFKAVKLYPDDPEFEKVLGYALGNQGRFKEAAEHLSKALELDPDSAATHDNLGVALLQLGRIEEAIHHFHIALDIDDTFNSALNHLQIAVSEREKAKGSSTSSTQN